MSAPKVAKKKSLALVAAKPATVTCSVVWDVPVLDAAKAAARKDGRSLSNYVNRTLRPILGLPLPQ